MPLSIRHDLRLLGDAELDERFRQVSQLYADAEDDVGPIKLRGSSRGPIWHPWAYPFISLLHYGRAPFWAKVALAISPGIIGLMPGGQRFRAVTRMHLALCEMRDIADEFDRRAASLGK